VPVTPITPRAWVVPDASTSTCGASSPVLAAIVMTAPPSTDAWLL
jgi:hypothetical protein